MEIPTAETNKSRKNEKATVTRKPRAPPKKLQALIEHQQRQYRRMQLLIFFFLAKLA